MAYACSKQYPELPSRQSGCSLQRLDRFCKQRWYLATVASVYSMHVVLTCSHCLPEGITPIARIPSLQLVWMDSRTVMLRNPYNRRCSFLHNQNSHSKVILVRRTLNLCFYMQRCSLQVFSAQSKRDHCRKRSHFFCRIEPIKLLHTTCILHPTYYVPLIPQSCGFTTTYYVLRGPLPNLDT